MCAATSQLVLYCGWTVCYCRRCSRTRPYMPPSRSPRRSYFKYQTQEVIPPIDFCCSGEYCALLDKGCCFLTKMLCGAIWWWSAFQMCTSRVRFTHQPYLLNLCCSLLYHNCFLMQNQVSCKPAICLYVIYCHLFSVIKREGLDRCNAHFLKM